MIYDTLAHLARYRGMNRNLDRVIGFAMAREMSALPLGRTDIDGDNAYVLIQEPELQPESAAAWECHDDYADLQLGLADGETVAYAPRDTVPDWGPYQPDARLSKADCPCVRLPLDAGRFLFLLPQDAHKPGIGAGKGRKAVFKIRCR